MYRKVKKSNERSSSDMTDLFWHAWCRSRLARSRERAVAPSLPRGALLPCSMHGRAVGPAGGGSSGWRICPKRMHFKVLIGRK
eukprot:1450632-Prymnesium_polylepis.1